MFSYVVPSVWCHPITEQLIVTVVSVLLMVVQRTGGGTAGQPHVIAHRQAKHST